MLNDMAVRNANGMLSPVEFERQQFLKAESVQKSRVYSVALRCSILCYANAEGWSSAGLADSAIERQERLAADRRH